MVAMVIGMLAVIVMFQMFSNSEAQKRSTTGAGDAQASANIALVTLKSDIRGAGYGFIAPDNGGKDVFVHISAVERAGLKSLNDNQKIEYELQSGRDGRASASDLKLL